MATKTTKNNNLTGMALNPETEGRMVEAYDYLVPLIFKSELPSGVDSDKFIRFIAYVYDPASPLISKFPELKTRKEYAASLTKFNAAEEHPQTVVLFLQQVIKSMEWTVIITMERTFEEFAERVNDPIKVGTDVKDEDVLKAVERKIKLIDAMKAMAPDVKALRATFFQNDDSLVEEAGRVLRSPEEMAKARTRRTK